jgi:hypothetical protein
MIEGAPYRPDRSEDRRFRTPEVHVKQNTDVLGSKEGDTPKASSEDTTIALKYLELSRAEILERLKLSNQFLIVYLGGVSALLGWLFTAKDPSRDGIVLQNVLPAVATGLSFLAFSLSWILSENEKMIEFHAKYQIEQLGKWLHRSSSVPLWEESPRLKEERPSTGAMLVHLLIINAPNIALTIVAAFLPSPALSKCWRIAFIAMAMVLSCASCGISLRMIRSRTKHRDSIPAPT